LRDCPEDIPLLAEHFLRRFARKHGIKVTGFSASACAAMLAYRWPGNVRELQNSIERAVILSEPNRPVSSAALGLEGDLQPVDIGAIPAWNGVNVNLEPAPDPSAPTIPAASDPAAAAGPGGPVVTLDELEKQAIRAALRHSGDNRTHA